MLVLAMEFSRGTGRRATPSKRRSDDQEREVGSPKSIHWVPASPKKTGRVRRPVAAPSKRNRGARPSSQRPTGDQWSTTGRCLDSRIASDRPRSTWTR
jgi:hypothetical protein